jgi:hydroxyacyl-ACP dehydratase HTD2-like protein with hotdog domain
VSLFRYMALIFNRHCIHNDRSYAQGLRSRAFLTLQATAKLA